MDGLLLWVGGVGNQFYDNQMQRHGTSEQDKEKTVSELGLLN